MKGIMNMANLAVTEFSRFAESYDKHAVVQKKSAEILVRLLKQNVPTMTDPVALEIGAGTGLLTCELLEEFPQCSLVCLDASSAMLKRLKKKIRAAHGDASVSAYLLDCNRLSEFMVEQDFQFDVIVSSFALQWIRDLPFLFKTLNKLLLPGGRLAFCLPGSNSFSEWQHACNLADVPFTANRLPSFEAVVDGATAAGFSGEFSQSFITQNFESSKDFFFSLKHLGASKKNFEINDDRPMLTTRQLTCLQKHWDDLSQGRPISVTYQTIFAILEKN